MSCDILDGRRIGDAQIPCRCHISHAVGSSAFAYLVDIVPIVYIVP